MLNTATVALGALIGWGFGARLPTSYQLIVMSGLGLVTVGIGLKMFLQAKHLLIIAGAIAFGGMIGMALGFENGLDAFAEWAKVTFGGEHSGHFTEAIVTTSILFCIGPMTLLGCLQDGLEGKIELLALKSTMDGIGSIFFAAALGPGVLVTAGVILVVQSTLTFLAQPLRKVAGDEEMLSEITGAGGVMLMGIGLGLAGIVNTAFSAANPHQLPVIPVIDYLPALVLAPLAIYGLRAWQRLQSHRQAS